MATGWTAEGYEVLFKGTKSKLTKEEKQQIFKKLGFRLASDKRTIVDETCDQDVSPQVELADLNGDGMEEVFVNWGNTCTSGAAGQTITLFVKGRKGQFVENLNIPGQYRKLPTKTKGFQDLLIGGPGFCQGVWRWTGGKYDYKCSREEQLGACASAGIKTVCR